MTLFNLLSILMNQIYGWDWSSVWLCFGSIGTLGLAIVTYQTVKEMKKSREMTSKPQLIFLAPQQEFQFLWTQGNPIETLNPVFYKTDTNDTVTGMPVLRLKNIGRGGAKNIKIVWSSDEEDIANIAFKNSQFKKYDIELKYNYANFHFVKDNVPIVCSIECGDNETTEIQYCIASYDNHFYDLVNIPENIQGSYMVRLIIMERLKKPLEFISAPTISMFITYQDLDGNEYNKGYKLQSTFIYLTNDIITDIDSLNTDRLSPDCLRGRLRFKIL